LYRKNDEKELRKMDGCGCGAGTAGKPVQYKCDCGDDCGCQVIEFDEEPGAVPHCCGVPMKRV
jgi:hypothetical protein